MRRSAILRRIEIHVKGALSYPLKAQATFQNVDPALSTLCECDIYNSLMLRDECFLIARTIVAITDLPRVRPRKLPKWRV